MRTFLAASLSLSDTINDLSRDAVIGSKGNIELVEDVTLKKERKEEKKKEKSAVCFPPSSFASFLLCSVFPFSSLPFFSFFASFLFYSIFVLLCLALSSLHSLSLSLLLFSHSLPLVLQ
jgi:hypothetical protein